MLQLLFLNLCARKLKCFERDNKRHLICNSRSRLLHSRSYFSSEKQLVMYGTLGYLNRKVGIYILFSSDQVKEIEIGMTHSHGDKIAEDTL